MPRERRLKSLVAVIQQGAALHVAFLALNSGVVRALQLGGGSNPSNYMHGLSKRQQREQGATTDCFISVTPACVSHCISMMGK